MDRRSLESGFAFSVVLLVAVTYFEHKAGFLNRGEYIALAAYLPVLIGAFMFGIKLSHWYVPIAGTKPIMELFMVPLCVILGSVVVASFIFSLASMLMGGIGPNYIEQLLSGGLFPGLVFIIGTWHILLVGGLLSSIYLVYRQKCF
ncbi:hypothetical protein [Simiduia aestuariiviva]|uniref:Uncharacterized protein n=1 Tax=Simiduia aestuariiviva TaxID=1510459 RepID=A0A839UN05_9GAMM|nr:hypothetical protein [Simiduia aestuariiviva]MBB3166958.1 hypothetical protein [Simiduia aestuariiviva]